MLEDDFNDILGKAVRGQGFDTSSLNLDPLKLRNCLNGEFDAEIIKALTPHLYLNTDRLLNLPFYQPKVNIPEYAKTFTSLFGHLGVNAFTIENESHLLIFDTGTNANDCINYISQFPHKEKHLFITHSHPDHTSCIKNIIPFVKSNQQIEPNNALEFGSISLTSLDVSGHCTPASAYLIQGSDTPICVVGDAIFAGSIGGVSQPHYKSAISNIRENILTLPAETILLNGHGPATSVALELENNPFF